MTTPAAPTDAPARERVLAALRTAVACLAVLALIVLGWEPDA